MKRIKKRIVAVFYSVNVLEPGVQDSVSGFFFSLFFHSVHRNVCFFASFFCSSLWSRSVHDCSAKYLYVWESKCVCGCGCGYVFCSLAFDLCRPVGCNAFAYYCRSSSFCCCCFYCSFSNWVFDERWPPVANLAKHTVHALQITSTRIREWEREIQKRHPITK